MRDDFDTSTKDMLARRGGYRYSNPACRKLTTGPQEDPTKALNIGVAAHITAASPRGPRYDSKQTSEERKSIDNGIWLCQNCAKLIDNDELRYTTDVVQEWKRLSEAEALRQIQENSPSKAASQNDDVELIRFYSQCLDRPAFQDEFHVETSLEAFDKAIEDTITAINTGCLRARDGQVLGRARGKSFLTNTKWRNQMDTIVDLLRALRTRFALAVQTEAIRITYSGDDGREFYILEDRELAGWMDSTRANIISIFNEICEECSLPQLRFPRHFRFW